MKVLVIHPYMSVLGGGERVCMQIVRALAEEDHEVILVSEPTELDELDETPDLGTPTNLTRIPYDAFTPRITKFSVYQRLLHHRSMRRKVRSEIHTADLEISTQDIMFLSDTGKKKVAYVHYPEYLVHVETAGPGSKSFWRAYYAPVLWYWHRQIEKYDLLICNSEYTRRAIKQKWGKEARVVYPPVNVEAIEPLPKQEFVATIGRFVRAKNYETVIEVAKLMPEVDFVIMGRKQDRDYYEKLRELKSKNVTLLADLPRSKLLSILARAKVYLHTMIGEHFGISIVEAIAAGCLPIVHNSGGARDLVSNVGYVYNNTEECSKCVQQALSIDIDVKRIAEKAERFSCEGFRARIREELRGNGLL